MDLLFKPTGFSKDLKELLGFVDADMNFNSLHSDLRSATKEIIKIIGKPLYETVVTAYKTDPIPADKADLIYHTRYPIAMNAYRLAAPTSDLRHTNNGRLMRVDDNEKSPFEWMIRKDDQNQERKYYRAIDELLNYLEEENVSGWKSSDAYKKLKTYFVNSTEDFDEYFPINSRLLMLKLMPGIRKAERDYVRRIVGKTKFDELKAAQQSTTGIPEADEPLVELIKEACVYYSLAWAMRRLTVQLFPEGVLQQYVSNKMLNSKKPQEQMESQAAFQEFTKDAENIFKEIEVLVTPEPTIPTPTGDEQPLDFDFGFSEDDKFASF